MFFILETIFFVQNGNPCVTLICFLYYKIAVFKKDFECIQFLFGQVTMSESMILFYQEFYKQQDGVVMGSPLGRTIANVFLCYHEKICLQNCPPQFKLLSIEDTLMIHSYFFPFLLKTSHQKIPKLFNS